MTNPPTLLVQNASVKLGNVQALNDLTLEVPAGSVFGLLGPNGAGKTTLIRAITGLLPLDSGRISLFNQLAPGSHASRKLIGYMPQQLALYPTMTVTDNILFFGRLYGVPEATLAHRLSELLEMVELKDFANAKVGELSGGMVRRVMLASVVIHQPKLLILDEPTAGVDPLLRIKFWDWFADLQAQGTSILVTTHHISESFRCSQVVFMRDGQLLENGTPQQLMDRYDAQDLETAFVDATRSQTPHAPAAERGTP